MIFLPLSISNVKAFSLGAFHSLTKNNLDFYLSEFCFRFNHRNRNLFERLIIAVGWPFLPEEKR